MTVLVLRLAGPLQAWGASSRFVRRQTERQPTKSGVIGLLAAALGRRRTDDIEDLLGLRFGVRMDQPGQVVRDFQTAVPFDGGKPMPLSYRFYLGDAAFVAAVEAAPDLIDTLDNALRRPSFPLFLGRRSCPPAGPVTLGTREGTLADVLKDEPWQAAPWWQREHRREPRIRLDVLVDAQTEDDPDAAPAVLVQDAPISFDPRRRSYGLRAVSRSTVLVTNPTYRPERGPALVGRDSHQPMDALGEL